LLPLPTRHSCARASRAASREGERQGPRGRSAGRRSGRSRPGRNPRTRPCNKSAGWTNPRKGERPGARGRSARRRTCRSRPGGSPRTRPSNKMPTRPSRAKARGQALVDGLLVDALEEAVLVAHAQGGSVSLRAAPSLQASCRPSAVDGGRTLHPAAQKLEHLRTPHVISPLKRVSRHAYKYKYKYMYKCKYNYPCKYKYKYKV
jgi:hypothetical protein